MIVSNWLRALTSCLGAMCLFSLPVISMVKAEEIAPENANFDVSRVVTIGGSLTEIVFALGQEDHLVARDSTSIYPPEALELPDIGYMRALSPEGVLSTNPSIIIMLEGSGPPEALDVLKSANVAVVSVPESFDGEGIAKKIAIIGQVFGVTDQAKLLAQQIAADIDAAEAATETVRQRSKVLFVLSLQGGRVLAAGTDTAADGMITMAGGVNVVTAYSGYKQLSDEAIIEAAPDVILAMDRGSDHQTEADQLLDQLLDHPAIAATPAGTNRKVVRMDGAFLLGFGPRTAEAARDLSAALYGEILGVRQAD